ncbi:MAG: ABC transporter permease [Thalassotalea sp.]|nr:ABC transporter permease [Thalassotalea sp.]
MSLVQKRTRIQVWQDVIFAIFVREIKSKFNDKVGISWAIINPLIFIFVLSFLRSQLGGPITHTMPTLIFMMFGMLIIQLFLSTFNSVSSSIKKNKALFAFRQVLPISAVLATGLFELLSKLVVIVVLLLIIYLIDVEFRLDDPLLILFYIFLVWLLSVSLGLIFAIGKAFVGELSKIEALLLRPMFFISGIFFSLQDIPKQYWPYLDWNPFLHAVELARDASYKTFGAQGVSIEYLLMCTLVSLFLALSCYRVFWKQVLSR